MVFSRPFLIPILLVLIIWTICVLFMSSSKTREGARLASDNRLLDIPPNILPLVVDVQRAKTHSNATAKGFILSNKTKQISDEYPICREKEGLVDILLRQDDNRYFQEPDFIRSSCQGLPSTQQIIDINGAGPVVLGLETCSAYRSRLGQLTDSKPSPRVAGLYHSGTNALARLLEKNIKSENKRNKTVFYEVPWGKHIPVKYRNINTFPVDHPDNPEDVLPIVIVRNPFDWMRSMCKEGYDALWMKSSQKDCPHLLKPGSSSIKNKIFVKAHQTQFRYIDMYDSLADFYSEWHRGYLDASFPRLFIRYEDLLLYPEQLLKLISKCSGSPMTDDFQYYNTEAREFVKASQTSASLRQSTPAIVTSTMFRALVKLGQRDGMYYTLQDASRAYALDALDREVLQAFHYQHLDDPKVPVNGYVNGPSSGKNDWLERRKAIVNERLQRLNQQNQPNISQVESTKGSLTNMGQPRRSFTTSVRSQSSEDETTQDAWDAKLMDLVKQYERRQQLRKVNEKARLQLLQARQRGNSAVSLSGRNQRTP